MPKLDPDKVIFTFRLTARQAQTVYSLYECMHEEPAFREIWNTKKRRAEAHSARRAFARQLNKQYAETGVEV